MLDREYGTFAGGINLPEDKDATLDAAITPIGRLRRLLVPLAPASGPAAEPTVLSGDRVTHGQCIARATAPEQVDVAAPLAGKVAGTVSVLVPDAGAAWRQSPALELTDLDPPAALHTPKPRYDWLAADAHSILARIAEGGLVLSRAPMTSVARWLDKALAGGVDTLIGNVVENTPYVTADHRLLAEHGADVVRGLAILARVLGVSDVTLAVDHRHTDAYRDAVGPARRYGIRSVAMTHKYPTGAEAVLTQVLAQREQPAGGSPLDCGVAVVDAATCWAIARWVIYGQPPTSRVVTLAGPRLRRPGNYLVPLGAPVADVLAAAEPFGEGVDIYGAAMTGRQVVPDAVVTPACPAVLALASPTTGLPTPCIRCGWCSQNCPARLNVAALNDDFELNRLTRASRRGAMACLGCGICTYLCPARLPLAWRVGKLKQALS